MSTKISLQKAFDAAWERVEGNKPWKCTNEYGNNLMFARDRSFGCFLGQAILNEEREEEWRMFRWSHMFGHDLLVQIMYFFERPDAAYELSNIHDQNTDTETVKKLLIAFAEKHNLNIRSIDFPVKPATIEESPEVWYEVDALSRYASRVSAIQPELAALGLFIGLVSVSSILAFFGL